MGSGNRVLEGVRSRLSEMASGFPSEIFLEVLSDLEVKSGAAATRRVRLQGPHSALPITYSQSDPAAPRAEDSAVSACMARVIGPRA